MFALPALALLFASTSPSEAPPPHAFRISISGGHYTTHEESIAVVRLREGSGPAFWAAERRKRIAEGSGVDLSLQHQWIDGRACPQLNAVLDSVATIPKPQPKPAGIPSPHGTRVKVAMPSKDGKYEGRSDYMGPVTAWWRQADKTLEPCWRNDPVTVNGAPVRASLDSAEAELRFRPLPSTW